MRMIFANIIIFDSQKIISILTHYSFICSMGLLQNRANENRYNLVIQQIIFSLSEFNKQLHMNQFGWLPFVLKMLLFYTINRSSLSEELLKLIGLIAQFIHGNT